MLEHNGLEYETCGDGEKVRGDLERCLIISPGSLTDQWQAELAEKFGLNFEILTGDMIQAARTANPFEHKKPV